MNWLGLSLAVAFFQALNYVTSKFILRETNAYWAAFWLRLLSLPLLALFLCRDGLPPLQHDDLWWLLALCGVGNGLVSIFYMQALEHDDLNVSLPMLAFTPAFLLLLSPLFLGEFPGPIGLGGIVLIVAGSYIMNLRDIRGGGLMGHLAPFRALVSRPGARLMLLVAFLWTLTATVDRLGVAVSSPASWGFLSQAAIVVFLLPTLVLPGARRKKKPFGNQVVDAGRSGDGTVHVAGARKLRGLLLSFGPLVLLGCIGALRQATQMYAISLTLTAYVIALKRLSILAGMILGALLFRERTGPARLAGASIMIAGAALIGIYG